MGDLRLRAVRAAYSRRMGVGDLGYTIYAAGFVLVVAVIPIVRALFLELSTPQALRALTWSGAPTVIAIVGGSCLMLLGAFGALRGPAYYPPFLALILIGSDIDRYLVLRRPFTSSVACVSAGSALVGSTPGIALILGDEIGLEQSLPLIIGGAAFGIIAGVIWALGQSLGRNRAWILSSIAGIGILATVFAPTLLPLAPWGWLGMLYPTHAHVELWPLWALAVLAIVAIFAVRPLLNNISGADIIDQSRRWESATSAAISGDPSLALSTFRPLPSVGRLRTAIAPGLPLAVVFWWRDIVGASRTPVRFAFSTLGLIISGALVGVANGEAGWVLGATGALLAFVSLGCISDGLRHAAEAFGAPQLYGLARGSLVLHHSSLPFTYAVLTMLLGSGLTILIGSSPICLGISGAVATLVFLVRLFDSAKGQLSPALLSPIPTPAGDLSSVIILIWGADAILLVTVTAAVAVFASHNGGAAVFISTSAVACAAVALLCVRRFRRLVAQ